MVGGSLFARDADKCESATPSVGRSAWKPAEDRQIPSRPGDLNRVSPLVDAVQNHFQQFSL
jgi:hypothetical protein